MTSPGILLFGERLSELQAVARAIVSPSSSLSTTATATAAESTTTTQQWTIDNKYYTAQLVLSMLTTEQHMADLPSLIDHQAVVAVFNAATATLPQVQELWTAAENHNINYEIKMVVALCTECSAPPKWLDEADAWCATRLAEFVVVQDLSAATPIESIPATERRDEDGLQRVIEALQAHMWPGMQRKSTPARNTVSLDFVDDDDDEEEDDTQVGEPSVEALLQAALRAEDDADDVDDGTDEFDRVFAEVVDFRQSMAGASRIQRADAAAEIVTRLQALMGEESDGAGTDEMNHRSQEESVDSSDDDDDDVDTPLHNRNGHM